MINKAHLRDIYTVTCIHGLIPMDFQNMIIWAEICFYNKIKFFIVEICCCKFIILLDKKLNLHQSGVNPLRASWS